MVDGSLPSVGVVVPTHNRPVLLRRTLESVLTQDYGGLVQVVVVFDRATPDHSLAGSEGGRTVEVVENDRTPGLAGSRNTGILRLQTELVAFCDDDDTWCPGKLARQVAVLRADPATQFVTTAMQVDHVGTGSAVRLAGKSTVTFDDLTRSRMSMLHSSSFVFRRAAVLPPDGFGLVDETMPRSMGEDWDLLLRAARRAPIRHIDEPLIRVLWGASSYFSDVWSDKIAANHWLVERYPELHDDPRTSAMMSGKLAFGHAALGHRRESLHYIAKTLRTRWREPRAALALLVLAGVPSRFVLTQLNKRGHSI
jgi:glycosyltransferase involved in cell wall biosynthesis